jgi:hypothetical protein
MQKLVCVFVNTSCAVKNIPILIGIIYKKRTSIYNLGYGVATLAFFFLFFSKAVTYVKCIHKHLISFQTCFDILA